MLRYRNKSTDELYAAGKKSLDDIRATLRYIEETKKTLNEEELARAIQPATELAYVLLEFRSRGWGIESSPLHVPVKRMFLPMTPQRLWFFYARARFTKSDIEELTGWERGQIDYRVKSWDLSMLSPLYLKVQEQLDGVELPATTDEIAGMLRRAPQELQKSVRAGSITWADIDRYPGEPNQQPAAEISEQAV